MKRSCVWASCLLLHLSLAMPCSAQQPLKAPGTFDMVNGEPRCQDSAGIVVRYLPNPAIAVSGQALMQPSGPVIFLNPAHVAKLAQPLLHFLYAHECGHHALGQIRATLDGKPMSSADEAAADCFAIHAMRRLGASSAEIATVIRVVDALSAEEQHAGTSRARDLSACDALAKKRYPAASSPK